MSDSPRDDLGAWQPAWMGKAVCRTGVGQPERVVRLVVERSENEDILECGHTLTSLFEDGEEIPHYLSYRRNCRLCGDRSYDVDIWFPPKGGPSEQYAREACTVCIEQCPVREECLDYAIDYRIQMGVWGGMTYRSRTALVPH